MNHKPKHPNIFNNIQEIKMKWYEQSIPRIQDVLPYIKSMCNAIKKSRHVKSIYAYNNFADNFDKQNERLKQFDIIIKTNFESGDLLAIDNSDSQIMRSSNTILIDSGYNPETIEFTKIITSVKPSFVDVYALSKDNKILHFGAIPESLEEHEIVQKEAEHKTYNSTGFDSSSFTNLTSIQRKKWQEMYEKYIREYSEGCPQGWYAVQNKIAKKISHTREIIM